MQLLSFTAVAINEELFSRGYVQGLIKYHFNTKVAVIVSSLLFALLHSFNPGVFNNPLPLLNLLLAGVLLGVSREVSGGLWMPIGCMYKKINNLVMDKLLFITGVILIPSGILLSLINEILGSSISIIGAIWFGMSFYSKAFNSRGKSGK